MCTDAFRANDTEPRQAFSEFLVGKAVIHDGPKRDRDPYMGDLAVSALTSYLTHDIHEAARNVSPSGTSLCFMAVGLHRGEKSLLSIRWM